MADRYDSEKFQKRSVEDIKDRYYKLCGILNKVILIRYFYLQQHNFIRKF